MIVFLFFVIVKFVPMSSYYSPHYTNPVIDSEMIDPYVVKIDEEFYAVSSNDGIFLQKSDDLQHWQPVHRLMTKSPSWAVSHNLWAPEIYQIYFDWYVLYFEVADNRSGIGAIGVAVSNKVSGPYHALDVPLVEMKTISQSDPHLLNMHGTLYFYLVKGSSHIFGRMMKENGLEFLDYPPVLVLNKENEAEINKISSPFVIYRKFYFYLFYTAIRGAENTMMIRVARSAYPLGPYTSHELPVFTGNNELKSPRRACIVQDVDDVNYALVFEANYKNAFVDSNKTFMNILPLKWEYDWPSVYP